MASRRFHVLLAAILAAALAGCGDTDDPKVFACKIAAKRLSPTPSAVSFTQTIAAPTSTFLRFDAPNAAGVPVGHSIECTYVSALVNSIAAVVIDGRTVDPQTLTFINGSVSAEEMQRR